eukprot:g11274.t1
MAGGFNFNPAAYRELRQQRLQGKGGKGKGKGKAKGKLAWKKLKAKAKAAKAAKAEVPKATRESGSGEDDAESEEVFWQPTWDTLGPMEEPAGKDDFGFNVILNRAPAMRSQKSLQAPEDEPEAPAQSRRARAQQRRRQRNSAYRPSPGDFAEAALKARGDHRLEAYIRGGKDPEETHFDELESRGAHSSVKAAGRTARRQTPSAEDWLIGFSELWLYALRNARLALSTAATTTATAPSASPLSSLRRAERQLLAAHGREERQRRAFQDARITFDQHAAELRAMAEVNATREVLASKHIPLPAEAQLNRNLIDTGENVDLGWLDGRSRHLKIFLPFRSTEDQ